MRKQSQNPANATAKVAKDDPSFMLKQMFPFRKLSKANLQQLHLSVYTPQSITDDFAVMSHEDKVATYLEMVVMNACFMHAIKTANIPVIEVRYAPDIDKVGLTIVKHFEHTWPFEFHSYDGSWAPNSDEAWALLEWVHSLDDGTMQPILDAVTRLYASMNLRFDGFGFTSPEEQIRDFVTRQFNFISAQIITAAASIMNEGDSYAELAMYEATADDAANRAFIPIYRGFLLGSLKTLKERFVLPRSSSNDETSLEEAPIVGFQQERQADIGSTDQTEQAVS